MRTKNKWMNITGEGWEWKGWEWGKGRKTKSKGSSTCFSKKPRHYSEKKWYVVVIIPGKEWAKTKMENVTICKIFNLNPPFVSVQFHFNSIVCLSHFKVGGLHNFSCNFLSHCLAKNVIYFVGKTRGRNETIKKSHWNILSWKNSFIFL